MSNLTGIWDAVWGLLVEDGSLAIGIVVALAITWAAAVALGEGAHDVVGWLLLAMLAVLVVFNLQAAGRRARRTIS
jgi:thiosulfate reductase cytochrome b subunit